MENLNDLYDYFEGRLEDPRLEHVRRVFYQVDVKRTVRDAQNPFSISVTEFRKLYRMPQHIFFDFVQQIERHCGVRTRPNAVPLAIRILCAVSFYASGSYQRPVGQNRDISCSQSSVSNFVEEITEVLNRPEVMSQFVRFPATNEEREEVIQRNLRLGLPRVLGFIDGSYVKIFPPSFYVEAYYCRKGFTALNVMVVCDADLRILAVDARFPGSCNDPYIFRNSGMREEMRRAYAASRRWLLGDSGYGHEPWIHLPLPHAPRGSPEARYTKAHCHARNVVERCFGVLKGRWRCLLCHRSLHYDPVKSGRITNACVVLHNFLISRRVENPRPANMVQDQGVDIVEDLQDNIPEQPRQLRALANEERQFLIDYVNNNH